MEKTGNEILEQIRTELDELKKKADELERRISDIDGEGVGIQTDQPFDILLDDEISFVIPKRKEELGIAADEPAAATEKSVEPEIKRRWQLDAPASEVQDILSAIALKERSIFINTLFKEDARLFMDTIAALNAMTAFSEAESYVREHFGHWKLDSDIVYKFMMAVRRKLR